MVHISGRRTGFNIFIFATVLLFILGQPGEAGAQNPPQSPPSSAASATLASAQNGVEILTPTEGVDFSSYIHKMARDVKKNWLAIMPNVASAGAKGRSSVQFHVRRDGKIENISLKASAGNDELDQAALKSVRDSSPFDPLPANFKGPYIELRFSFAYNTKRN